jgi:DNA-directed RNA polymerase omega subunit
MDHIPEKIDSKFRYVLLAAHRAEQMMRGSQPKLPQDGKLTTVAMDEIRSGVVQWDYGPGEEMPLAEEGEAVLDEGAADGGA